MTNLCHVLATMLLPVTGSIPEEMSFGSLLDAGVRCMAVDAMRCWTGARETGHFTVHPQTGVTSWIQFPREELSEWSESLLKQAKSFNAGRPGPAAIDEDSMPREMWRHNRVTAQNVLFYLHVVQDRAYDRLLRSLVDTSRRYEDVYVYRGEYLTGDQFRGKADNRWKTGLVNLLDNAVQVELSRRVYRAYGLIPDAKWVSDAVIPTVYRIYSEEFATRTVPFIRMNDTVNTLVSTLAFKDSAEVYPFEEWTIRQGVSWILQDMNAALWSLPETHYK